MSGHAFLIDPGTLAGQVDAGTFQRGLAVYRNQQVLSCELSGASTYDWTVSGEVQGSGRDVYHTVVGLTLDGQGTITSLQGNCSCPVSHDCKHAVALVLRAAYRLGGRRPGSAAPTAATPTPPQPSPQERERQRAAQQVSQWLDLFGNHAPTDEGAHPAARDGAPEWTPVFTLRALSSGDKNAPCTLHLGWALSRRLRNGQWAKLRTPAYGADSDAPPETQPIIRLVQSLALGTSRYGSGYYGASSLTEGRVTGEPGLLALQLAARQGRLFYCAEERTLSLPLAWGEPRGLQWQWREAQHTSMGEPSWSLLPRLAPQPHEAAEPTAAPASPLPSVASASDAAAAQGVQWFANSPPLYLDLVAGRCGPIECPGLTPEHLALLLRAPPIPQSAFAQHEASLLRRLAGLPLPPVMTPPREVRGITPRAVLHLAQVPPGEVVQRGLLEARLTFDYDGQRHYNRQANTPVLLTEDAAPGAVDAPLRVLLHRDLPAEQAAHDALHALGLHGDASGRFHLLFQSHAQQQQWLRWADEDFAPLRAGGFDIEADPALAGWIARADALHVRLAPHGAPAADEGDADDEAPAPDFQAAWFDLSLGMSINGQRHNILPLLPELLARVQPEGDDSELPPHVYLPQPGGGYLRLPTAPLAPWLHALLELLQANLDGEHLRLTRTQVLRVGASLGEGVAWEGAAQLRDMVAQLRGQHTLPAVVPPAGLHAELRPYQQHGLNWLQFLRANALGGLLADDMGLGKTLQTLAHLLIEKEAGRLKQPALVIAPVSLMGNWQREATRFAPALRTLVWHGQQRHTQTGDWAKADLLIAPYSLLHRERERWLAQPFSVVVLDEAQHIKNAASHAAQVVGELHAGQRLALSGTPLENHLGELWSLFHFLMPGFLGSHKEFTQLFRTPIEKHGDSERLAQLRRRVTPFMLRRAKAEVAADLPPKQGAITPVTLGDAQANLYETIRLTTEKAVREALAGKGLARSHIEVLDALLKLRQVCCDPRLLPTTSARQIKQSAKLDLLMELLPELLAEGRRVLLFSQFTSMLTLIEQALAARQLPWTKLTGQTQKRDAAIARFTSGEVPLFLISLKAGGVGLNLTQADTVIHYDPWWNPAAENQATDRAHRIGQTQPVMVYKLVAEGTIEERILALQARKAALASSLYSEAAARKQPLFTEGDLAELLRPLGT